MRRRQFIDLVLVAVLLAPASLPITATAQLPSESLLPGDTHAEPSYPSESQLPSYAIAWQQAGRREDSSDDPLSDGDQQPNVNAQRAEAVELPGEGQLPAQLPPPEIGVDPAQAARGGGLPVAGSPDGIPWLRLNLPGHSAPLRAVTFTSDGQRICSAGEDKSMVVWRAGEADRRVYERAVRWQVQRGLRGRIYALAAGPDYVGMAGEGAMGAAGEIVLVDPQSGDHVATLNDVDNGHRQVVLALSVAPGSQGKTMASLSIDGCLMLWNQGDDGLWRATRLRGTDVEVYPDDPALANRLAAGRRFSAAVAVNSRRVAAPAYSSVREGRTIWRLQSFNATTGASEPLMANDDSAPHWDYVTAMAISGNGRLLASSDGGGHVYLWDVSGARARLRRLPQLSAPALSLDFDAAGSRLALGTAPTGDRRAELQVWDVSQFANPRQLARLQVSQPVTACALSPDGQTVAWTSGSTVQVRPIRGGAVRVLASGAAPPLKVAFSQERPFHTIGFSKRTSQGPATIDHVFDTSRLRLDVLNLNRRAAAPRNQQSVIRWLPDDWLTFGWNIRTLRRTGGVLDAWMYEGDVRRASVPLDATIHGEFREVCWIPSRIANARPVAAAVGTSSGGIYIFQPADQGAAPTIRHLRGHTAEVTSLAVSRDLSYLASASLDGTIRVWPLKSITTARPLVHRWGGEFGIQDDQLLVASVRRDGPVYFRGMRAGDRITKLQYVDDPENVHTVIDPEAMLAALNDVGWDTLMNFEFVRGRAQPRSFQILPAWQQLATLFAADNGQWAYWAPAGYYDASFEGHKLFGWQINRGLQQLPDFFLAAQFRQQLERPRVMSRLLSAGNLEAAFEAARLEPPANSPEAIVNAYRLKPEVEILSPSDGDVVENATKLRAEISVDAALRLVPPKAFANGVAAVNRRLVSSKSRDRRLTETYEWELSLPSDPELLLQVTAATENEISESDRVVVAYNPPPRDTPPRLHLVSVGVDQYRDSQIPRLSTAVQSTHDLLTLLHERGAPLYRIDATSLLDDRATKPAWQYLTSDIAERLRRDASPDDLLVIFLSGHGVQGVDDAGYQFVTADARYSDVLSGQYADCLSFDDLAQVGDVPCRKIVILNTCHGGAIQPLMHRDMKSAVRDLQHDLLITLAASGGEQEAVEGRFARRLLEALSGAADANSDGVVGFDETVAYVQRTVEADSSGDAVRQIPTAGPRELLPYLTLKLAETHATADRSRTQAGDATIQSVGITTTAAAQTN